MTIRSRFAATPEGALEGNRRARRQGFILGRALLLVPAFLLLAFALWQRTAGAPLPAGFEQPTEPTRTGAVAAIDGWEGRVLRDGAAPLRLRLEPLHPEEQRQAYDAGALYRTVRKSDQVGAAAPTEPDGEPWRLTLSVPARPGAAGGERLLVVETLADVRLEGFEAIVTSKAPGQTSGQGALATLLTFPDVPLREGEAHDLIFWGPAPEGPVRAIVPGVGDVELMTKTRSAGRASNSIAQLDGRPGSAAGTRKGESR